MEDIFKGLIDFVLKYTEIKQENVRQGFQNRVGIPPNANFCLITHLFSKRDMRNLVKYNAVEEKTEHQELITATFQLDFYGDKSNKNASDIKLLLEDYIACEFLEEYNCQPITCSDLRNHTGDTILNEQYRERYSFDVEVNYYNTVVLDEPYFSDVKFINKKVK